MAVDSALQSQIDGGIPIGASLVDNHGFLVASSGSQELQLKSFIHHAVIECLERATHSGFNKWNTSSLYTTTSPCRMCCAAILLHGIETVIVGETYNQTGNLDTLRDAGVVVTILHSEQCKNLLSEYIADKPLIWKNKNEH